MKPQDFKKGYIVQTGEGRMTEVLGVGKLADGADKDLVAYARFRAMTTEYMMAQSAPGTDPIKMQTAWLESLRTFVKDFPTSSETPEALLQLAIDAGFSVEERKVDIEEWQKKTAAGEITEVFACGTAAVVTPIVGFAAPGPNGAGDRRFTVGDGTPGTISQAIRAHLLYIQYSRTPDTHGWLRRV